MVPQISRSLKRFLPIKYLKNNVIALDTIHAPVQFIYQQTYRSIISQNKTNRILMVDIIELVMA